MKTAIWNVNILYNGYYSIDYTFRLENLSTCVTICCFPDVPNTIRRNQVMYLKQNGVSCSSYHSSILVCLIFSTIELRDMLLADTGAKYVYVLIFIYKFDAI